MSQQVATRNGNKQIETCLTTQVVGESHGMQARKFLARTHEWMGNNNNNNETQVKKRLLCMHMHIESEMIDAVGSVWNVRRYIIKMAY